MKAKAKIRALATSGDDAKNSIRAANELRINKPTILVCQTMFVREVNALTLVQTKGMYLTESWYWDPDDTSRK